MTRTEIRETTGIRSVTITPELAEEWLRYNVGNRKASEPYESFLADEMVDDNFIEYTGETIKFTPEGILIDGQHRLLALMKSGRTLTLSVAFGVPEEAFKVIDSGRTRSAADTLFVEGVQSYTAVTAATIKYLINWTTTNTTGNTSSVRRKITNHQVLEYYRENEALLKQVVLAAHKIYDHGDKLISASLIAAFMCYYNNEQEVETFFKQCSTGLGITHPTAPAYLLRSTLIRYKSSKVLKLEKKAMVLYVAKALDLHRMGREVKNLHIRTTNTLKDFLDEQE